MERDLILLIIGIAIALIAITIGLCKLFSMWIKKSLKENYCAYGEAYEEFDVNIFTDETYSIKNKVKVAPYTLYRMPEGKEPYSPKARLTHDRFGLRTPYLEVPKKENTYRICILGGSVVWGSYALRNEMTIPALLEKRLKERFLNGLDIQVVNCGVGGFASTQELIFLELMVLKRYKPDMVIVYDGFNDFISTVINKTVGFPVMWKMYMDMMNNFVERRFIKVLSNVIYQVFSRNELYYRMRPYILKLRRAIRGSRKVKSESDYANKGLFMESATYYHEMHKNMHKLLNGFNIPCISVIQPALGYGKKTLTPYENKIHRKYLTLYGKGYYEYLKVFYDEIRRLFAGTSQDMPWSDTSGIFDDTDEAIFIDYTHTGDRGVKKAEEKIFNSIEKHILASLEIRKKYERHAA